VIPSFDLAVLKKIRAHYLAEFFAFMNSKLQQIFHHHCFFCFFRSLRILRQSSCGEAWIFELTIDRNRINVTHKSGSFREHPAKSDREYLSAFSAAGRPLNMEGKRCDMRRLLIPYLLARTRHRRSGDSNISAVHATDFGSSLCKSRINPPRPSRSRTFRRPA